MEWHLIIALLCICHKVGLVIFAEWETLDCTK